jgi:hypothetical protein
MSFCWRLKRCRMLAFARGSLGLVIAERFLCVYVSRVQRRKAKLAQRRINFSLFLCPSLCSGGTSDASSRKFHTIIFANYIQSCSEKSRLFLRRDGRCSKRFLGMKMLNLSSDSRMGERKPLRRYPTRRDFVFAFLSGCAQVAYRVNNLWF